MARVNVSELGFKNLKICVTIKYEYAQKKL